MDSLNNSLSSLFSPLLGRLRELTNYVDVVLIDHLPEPNLLYINRISNEIFEYPIDDSISLVDFTLSKIKIIQERGNNIVDGIGIQKQDAFEGSVWANKEESQKAKNEILRNIQNELKLYTVKLSDIKTDLLHIQKVEKNSNPDSVKALLVKAKDLPKDSLSLDIRQFALLFQYLRDFKVIHKEEKLPNSRLSIPISLMTGFSHNTIAKEDGFGAINFIKADKPDYVHKSNKKDTPLFNLNSVKAKVAEILNAIDSDIKDYTAKSRKK